MKSLREAYGLLVVVLLTLGYAASQWAALTGTAADYAARVDHPQIAMLSLIILILGIGLSFSPTKDTEENKESSE